MSRYFGCVLCVVAVLGVCGVAQASYISTVLGDNPAVFYPMDETSGTVVNNLGTTGAAENGTYNGTFTLGQASAYAGLGTTPLFNGTNCWVSVPANPAWLVGTGDFTMEAWVKAASDSNRHEIFSEYPTANNTYQNVWIWNQGGGLGDNGMRPYLQYGDGSHIYKPYGSGVNPTVSAAAWHYVVLTRATVGATTTYTEYVDGVAKVLPAPTYMVSIDSNFDGVKAIGANYQPSVPATQYYWNGNIDDFAFYTTALSQAQVSAHFAAASAPVPEPSTLALLAAGLAGLLCYAWRKRR